MRLAISVFADSCFLRPTQQPVDKDAVFWQVARYTVDSCRRCCESRVIRFCALSNRHGTRFPDTMLTSPLRLICINLPDVLTRFAGSRTSIDILTGIRGRVFYAPLLRHGLCSCLSTISCSSHMFKQYPAVQTPRGHQPSSQERNYHPTKLVPLPR